ncbi:sigma 54-interacting transcriptional regulator [Avibacterium sp. 21-586]|uniref:sigma 54-interacting transcriptional regulator n=1 Tax=Avibacterium sp. 21-586 TaxID=2911534 RepID=UPI00224563AA|nr:sigma 54-interacting transcriptional regulator [Avibacterium sp. 21-586]MCW9710218.1 sigma 54-interacting transcriptional regulator [Avibacterium sp. 21-586]
MSAEKDLFSQMVMRSHKMKAMVEKAKKFALLDAPLLIQGETGTGKDLIAKACHFYSPRGENKFIAVNCAGLPSEDAESEMFGRANSQAESQGFFEYANGGTVLLDSVAELPLILQAKLLRFLNDGTFRRVGEEKEHYADVRVICTSQVPLSHYVEKGKMREDLFHRLNVLSLNIPPLRERQEDIPVLSEIFIHQISQELGILVPHLDETLLNYLTHYTWGGNVRELYNALYRACSLSENNQLTIADLGLEQQQICLPSIEQFGNQTLDEMMNNFEAMVLQKFYEEYPSTRKLASRLGVSHTAIANKLKQYGIGK